MSPEPIAGRFILLTPLDVEVFSRAWIQQLSTSILYVNRASATIGAPVRLGVPLKLR